jgi:hypothetical protein
LRLSGNFSRPPNGSYGPLAAQNRPLWTVAESDEPGSFCAAEPQDSNTLAQTAQRIAAERDDRAHENANQATIAAIAGLGGSGVLVGFFATYMSRAIVRPVRQASVTAHRTDHCVQVLARPSPGCALAPRARRAASARNSSNRARIPGFTTSDCRITPWPSAWCRIAEWWGTIRGSALL